MTEEENAQAYLREVASSINFLNKKAQKEVIRRGVDVLTEVRALKKYAIGIMHETRDIARQEFLAGVQRYLIGFFEDSIYHSTLSVEMGLLIRLEEELSDNEKKAIYDRINSKKDKPAPFTFGVIFDESKRKGRNIIKNEQTQQRIAKIIDVRNTHIHASNFTSASILSVKEKGLPKIEKSIKEINEIQETPLVNVMLKKWLFKAKNLLTESKATIESLPSFEWCTRDKQRSLAQDNINNFFSEIFASIGALQNIQSLSEKVQLGLHSRKFIRDLSKRDYSKTQALETIRDSFAVLKSIDIF